MHGDVAIGVAGVTHDESADIGSCIFFYCLALTDKNLTVDVEKVLAFHAFFTGNTAYEEGPIDVFKSFVEVSGRENIMEERECAVIELHDDAFKGLESLGDFDEVKGNGLVFAEDLS